MTYYSMIQHWTTTSDGREFQTLDAANGIERQPMVARGCAVTCISCDVDK